MGTDSRGSGGGESAPGPAADPGEWLTVSVWVCDSVSVGVKAETGRAEVSGPAWGWGGGNQGL